MANNISRNQENKLVMTSIYNALVRIDMNEELDVESLMADIFETSFDEISVHAKLVVVKALKNLDEIISAFQANMPKWKFSRLNKLNQAILIMSYSNYKLVGDIDKSVVINVAVDLAKEFLDATDYKFVNAILDNVL